MKKIISILLCLAMVTGLLSGCRETSDEVYVPTGDALVMEDTPEEELAQDEEPQKLSMVYYPSQSMNPILCTSYTNRAIFPLLYQSLFVVDRNKEVVPQLCSSYTVSDDLRTYEFFLDSRATFSDGTPVTSEDVRASLWDAWDSTYYSGRFLQVGSLYTAGDNALIINLKQPCANLPILLDIPIVKAAEVESDFPLGSGPYILSGTEENRFLSRRSNWWCSSKDLLITANRIPLLAAENPTEVRDYFEFYDAGIVCTDPGSDRYVEYRCDYELWDCETGLFLYLGFNLNSGLFKDVAVRKAVLKGIDREKLTDTFYRGFAVPAELPASPNSPYYSRTLAQNYAYNDVEFMNLMASAGAMGYTVRLLVNSDDSLRARVAKEISNMLNACGLIVTVVEVGTSEYRKRLSEGEFEMYLGQTKLSPNMDLTPFFSEGGALSYGGLADISRYTLCLQALESESGYYTLHQTVMDQALICPLLFRSYAVYAARGLLTQLQPARDNLFFYTIE